MYGLWLYKLSTTHQCVMILDCVWREHYLKQRAHNQQLEAKLQELERKLADLKSEMENGITFITNSKEYI